MYIDMLLSDIQHANSPSVECSYRNNSFLHQKDFSRQEIKEEKSILIMNI